MKQAKNTSIELLRIIACLFVIFNHTIFYFSDYQSISPNNIANILVYISFFISKTAVPIFIIISGFTMLEKEYSYRTVLKKAGRILIVLFCASSLIYLNDYLLGKTPALTLQQFISAIWNGSAMSHYWYLYLYVGLLLAIPFLQKIVKIMNKKDFQFYFIVSFLFGSLWPILNHYIPALNYSSDFNLSFFNVWIGLLLLGYYFKKYTSYSKRNFITAIAVFIISIVTLIIGTVFEYKQDTNNFLFFDDRTLLPIVTSSASLFYIVSNINCKSKNLISKLSTYTFGIYLLHDLLIFYVAILYPLINQHLPMLLTVIILDIIIFFLGIFVLMPLKKIKYVNKFI